MAKRAVPLQAANDPLTADNDGGTGLDRNSVQKVCALLRSLSARAPQRLSQLSASTGLNKVTALRILDTLAREGFVVRHADGRGYGPGPEILALGASVTGLAGDLRDAARPSLVRLAALSEDTALLSVRSGVEAVCLDRQTGSFPIRANYLDVGSRRPLGVGAGSLALLAWLPDREVEAVLAVITTRLDSYPLCDESVIRGEIAAARERGYVVVLDWIIDRMGAVGAPIRNPAGEVVGALSIAALSERVRDRATMLGKALIREASLIREEAMDGRAGGDGLERLAP
jgi:DNA-binding IclR family transcriptional regulator